MEEQKKIIKVKDLDKYVIFSIAVLLVYAIVNIILECHGVHVSDVLTTCVYTAFGGETLYCAVIKIFKVKNTETK